jgi:cell division protein FtsI/penicillin-binding protein 2
MSESGGALAALNWRLRLVQRLLYGQNVDRSVKSRARVGLAILVFSIGYAVIAGRLIQLAAAPDSQTVRRTADAVSTSRPDILGRNGEILATDIKAASLFGEPRKIIDVDEAVELLTAVLPDLDAAELRERLSSRKGSSGSSATSPKSSSRKSTVSAFPVLAFSPRTSASIRMAPRSRISSAM